MSKWKAKAESRQHFRKQSKVVAVDDHKVPDSVNYEKLCGAVCPLVVHSDISKMVARWRDTCAALCASESKRLKLPIVWADFGFGI